MGAHVGEEEVSFPPQRPGTASSWSQIERSLFPYRCVSHIMDYALF